LTVKPARLRERDGVGIIAPAGPITPSELSTGIAFLISLGHRVALGSHIYSIEGYMAGDDEGRLEDLHAMFKDDRVKAILCARGGYGTLRLLNRIDYELIRRKPKIMVGYSDITALLWAFYCKTGLVTFHGPVVRDLSEQRLGNLKSFFSVIGSGDPMNLDLSGGQVVKPGKARGVLLGGNLSLICHLIGTPFMPSLRGVILFIEDKGEALYRIDRMLTHLKLSGLCDGLAGVLIGGFEQCAEPLSINDLVLDRLADLEIPIVSGLKVGHGRENIVVPLGVSAVLDSESMTLSITEPCVLT
jgi:muramoyltetrapeptide carboxypeptidase